MRGLRHIAPVLLLFLSAGCADRPAAAPGNSDAGAGLPDSAAVEAAFDSADVRFQNDRDGVELAGTLTIPRAGRPCPACVLLSGVGAHDRDYTCFGHKPFLVLAEFLSRRGVAALRVDDRGVGGSGGSRAGATPEDFARDAQAAVAWLRSRPEIAADRVGIVGHSEGGITATLAAADSDAAAFVVLLAAPGLPGEEYNLQFEASMGRAMGLPEEALREKAAFQKRVFAILAGGETEEAKRSRLEAHFATLEPPPPPERVQASVTRLLSPWMRFSLSHDPGRVIPRVRCPVLAVFGGKDMQVPAARNAEVLETLLSGRRDGLSAVKRLPGHNHFFQRCETGGPEEYARIGEGFSPVLLAVVGDWISAVAGR